MKESKDNPILHYIGPHPIRKENRINYRVGQAEYEKLIRLHMSLPGEPSLPKIIAMLSQACEKCGHDTVTITIKKGTLSTKKAGSGGNITTQNSNDGR